MPWQVQPLHTMRFKMKSNYMNNSICWGRQERMAGVDNFLVYLQTGVKYISLCTYHPEAVPPDAWYIQNVVFYSTLYIHQEWLYNNDFLISSNPKPGAGVYIYGVQI